MQPLLPVDAYEQDKCHQSGTLTACVAHSIMASVDHLVPFVRVSDDGVANIRSVSLEGAWRVPLSMVRMEVQEIIRLALTVSGPSTTLQDQDSVSSLLYDNSPQLAGDDESGVSIPLDQPPTASEAKTLHEYRKLMALGSVFALVKYWVFMRMLWRHDGESDRVVISVMAHSENMKQPTPLRNARNRKRWTIVRHGLNLMEILLNDRSLLLEVMKNRHLSFTNLICLRSDYLTPSTMLRLVEKAQHLNQDATQPTRGSALSLATLSALCQQGEDKSTQQTAPRLLSNSSPVSASSTASRHQARRTSKDSIVSNQSQFSKERGETTRVRMTKKRKRHRSVSRKRSTRSEKRSMTSSDSNEEDAVDNSDSNEENIVDHTNHRQLQLQQQRDEQSSSEDVVQSLQDDGAVSSPPLAQSHSLPLDRLHAARLRMASLPLLDYFYQLLETYPQHLTVAAPFYFESTELHHQVMSHRLQERCSTCTPVYDHAFLLRHSNRLLFLPALSIGDNGQLGLHGETHPTSSINVWVFARGDRGGIARLYQQLFDDGHSSLQSHQPPLIPAELYLQHGTHLVLVFQRQGETIAQPNGYELHLLHCVHNVCAGTTLSTSGVFCSQQHLVEMLQRRAAACDGPDTAYHASEMEQYTLALPTGVFKSSPLAQPVMLAKPCVKALQRVGHAKDISGCDVDFHFTDQMLYLLDQSLNELDRRRLSPPLQLLAEVQQLCHLPGLRHASHQDVLLALLTKIIALHTVTKDATPFITCSPGLGCGTAGLQDGSLPSMTVGQERTPAVVFRYSEPSSLQRLLYVRAPYAYHSQLQQFHDDFYEAVLNRGEPCTYQSTFPTFLMETTSARAPCCVSSASLNEVVDENIALLGKQDPQSSTQTVIPAALSLHDIRAAPVISVDNLVLTSAALSSSMKSKLSTFLPAELVNGGVLQWCQAASPNPSFHLFAASELAIASRQAHSILIPASKGTESMGWYNHMLHHRSCLESSELVSMASVRQAEKQSQIEKLYVLCTELVSLVQAADVIDESSQCLLSPFVSTTAGEVNQASAQKVIECMVENGLPADSLFLDIGCCYCKVLVHVAYATGINVYGVEAVQERTERGKRCVQRWKATNPELARHTGGIEIFAGDIIHNLHLLFPATHVLVLDASFMPSTKSVLKHVWGHLAGAKLQMVFTCTMLEDVNDSVMLITQLQVEMGEEQFTLYAYKVNNNNNNPSSASVEVFPSSVHGSGLRAGRGYVAGETVIEVHGTKSTTYTKDDRWPWMVRLTDGWLHVENLARFVNWHHDEARINVSMNANADGLLHLHTTRRICKGEELLSPHLCWAFSAKGELNSEVATSERSF